MDVVRPCLDSLLLIHFVNFIFFLRLSKLETNYINENRNRQWGLTITQGPGNVSLSMTLTYISFWRDNGRPPAAPRTASSRSALCSVWCVDWFPLGRSRLPQTCIITSDVIMQTLNRFLSVRLFSPCRKSLTAQLLSMPSFVFLHV